MSIWSQAATGGVKEAGSRMYNAAEQGARGAYYGAKGKLLAANRLSLVSIIVLSSLYPAYKLDQGVQQLSSK